MFALQVNLEPADCLVSFEGRPEIGALDAASLANRVYISMVNKGNGFQA
jgi:hypothetical protein